jgi:hypothetical protein
MVISDLSVHGRQCSIDASLPNAIALPFPDVESMWPCQSLLFSRPPHPGSKRDISADSPGITEIVT